jgi:hypothetical protein
MAWIKLNVSSKYLLLIVMTLLLSPILSANAGTGTASVGNVAPTITSDSIYDDTHTTNVNNTMVNPAAGGNVEEYEVTATIGDDNTLNDIANVTVYVYDDNAITGHGFTKGTYNEVGSYGFAWVNSSGTISWKELNATGWSTTLTQLDSAACSYPTLTGSSGDWVFEFKMNKVSRRTATSAGWKVEVQVYDDDGASASKQDLQFGANFYHEEIVVSSVTWTSLSLGSNNNTANSNPYTFTVTANAPFKIQIKSIDSQLTGQTYGQTPINVGNVTIDDDSDPITDCIIPHLTTGWHDLGTNSLGSSKTNDCYWFLSIPSIVRDDTYSFDFSSQVIINE